ncbi:hypothetical protein [Halomarina rubra]|uniref:Class III signal peptide-containing protein n=1 Tax=Halomarina rubra TaxID=2071873 RepID=A0ABD6AQJ4_9EURY|nr:hypothetical protein [Halomarina rubra]
MSDDVSPLETALSVLSVAFTVALFAFVLYQTVSTPMAADPTVRVLATETTDSGEVLVTVELRNQQGSGLASATVEVACDDPAPDVTFEHVPADGTEEGVVRCPADSNTTDAAVATWIPA